MENSDVFLGLQYFLERMRQPTAADFVKSIKSFMVSFSNNEADPERDSGAVQDFFAQMEMHFRAHPLWAGCSEEELESAGEGLEKYVMTKLYSRVFASLPDDVKVDEQLYEKMALVQQFIRPENLDIKPTFQNETSWLLAQKELQTINMYKAPRDKLVCILNCCKVINNLLLNASVASNENPPGADEFLPVLIFVTLKANPPQLHSNLLYIQRYRRQSRLVGEASYFFTNMLSVESFITNIDAKSLSMDETEFEKNMETARALLSGLSTDSDSQYNQSGQFSGYVNRSESIGSRPSNANKDSATQPKSSERKSRVKNRPYAKDNESFSKVQSLSDLEDKGAQMLVNDDQASQVFQEHPYLFAHVGDLTLNDVEDLLNNYKQLVFKYVCLSKGLGVAAPSLPLHISHTEFHQHAEIAKEQDHSRAIEPNDETSSDTDRKDDGSNKDPLIGVEHLKSKLSWDQEAVPQDGKSEESSQ